jgi:hypothetical protein
LEAKPLKKTSEIAVVACPFSADGILAAFQKGIAAEQECFMLTDAALKNLKTKEK